MRPELTARLPEGGPAISDRPYIVLVAKSIGINAGGEAIKAQHFLEYLREQGYAFVVVTHERSLTELGADLAEDEVRVVPDTLLQKLMWRVPGVRELLDTHFHLAARRLIRGLGLDPASTVIHYIAPVSPVTPRFPPSGYRVVMGPLTGNIYYPPGFRDRMPARDKIREALHRSLQVVLGRLFGDKKRADRLLVSGYDRTRASLRLAGCRDAQMVDVVDAGVSDRIAALPRVRHEGVNGRFMCSGRLIDLKGIDLAIRAIASSPSELSLDIFGEGPARPALEALIAQLSVGDRVRLRGWIDHALLVERYGDYRGYVFPSLAEANGIVMQEAMMVGLPVIALRWGGPAMLADDASAIYVEPNNETHVVAEIARAMGRLSISPEEAEQLSITARVIAETKFRWPTVAESWTQAYDFSNALVRASG